MPHLQCFLEIDVNECFLGIDVNATISKCRFCFFNIACAGLNECARWRRGPCTTLGSGHGTMHDRAHRHILCIDACTEGYMLSRARRINNRFTKRWRGCGGRRLRRGKPSTRRATAQPEFFSSQKAPSSCTAAPRHRRSVVAVVAGVAAAGGDAARSCHCFLGQWGRLLATVRQDVLRSYPLHTFMHTVACTYNRSWVVATVCRWYWFPQISRQNNRCVTSRLLVS